MGQYFCQSIRKGMEHFWNFNKALKFVLILQKKILSIATRGKKLRFQLLMDLLQQKAFQDFIVF